MGKRVQRAIVARKLPTTRSEATQEWLGNLVKISSVMNRLVKRKPKKFGVTSVLQRPSPNASMAEQNEKDYGSV